jgi:hypothetical protein
MINAFSGNDIMVPIHYLTFKGVDRAELIELINLNKNLPREIRHFDTLNLRSGPEVFYRTIPEEFRKRYALPETGKLRDDLELYFGVSPNSDPADDEKGKVRKLISASIVEAYKYEWPDYAEQYFEYTHRLDKVEYYAKKNAVFNVCKTYHEKYSVKIKEVYNAFLPFAKTFLKSISLDRFYKIFEAPNLSEIMVNKNLGSIKANKNFTDDAKLLAFDEYTDRNKKMPEILVTVNQFLEDHGCYKIDIQTLRRYFEKPAIKRLVFQARYKGDIDTLTGFFPYLDRQRCSKRNMQWQLDADTMPLNGQEGTRRLNPKYYVVVDNHSGDPIGYSFCESENATSALEALRMAVYTTGCLPYELLTDNAPCYDEDPFKTAITLMKFYGCRHRRARIKGANDKTIVEGTFRSIHTIWRSISGYKGHRIKAKRRDSFPSEQYRMLAQKRGYIYDYAGLAAILPEVILKYRNHSFTEKPTTKERYDSSQSPEDRVLELWKIGKLFWQTQEMSVVGNRIVFSYKGQEYKFRIMETLVGLAIDKKVIGRFNHFDPERLLIYDPRTDIFIAELTAHESISTLEEDMSEFDHQEFESYNKKLNVMKQEVNEMLEKKKNDVKAMLKRTRFKKRTQKLEHDPSRVEGLDDYFKNHNLFDRAATETEKILVTELDKVSQGKESVNVKFNSLQIIDEL